MYPKNTPLVTTEFHKKKKRENFSTPTILHKQRVTEAHPRDKPNVLRARRRALGLL
jgi:hypothetical protein